MNNTKSESLFRIKMFSCVKWFKNSSGLSTSGLCKAYAECTKPYVEMEKYGEVIDIIEYALIEQGDTLLFSIDFDEDENTIDIFDGDKLEEKPLKETLQKLRTSIKLNAVGKFMCLGQRTYDMSLC